MDDSPLNLEIWEEVFFFSVAVEGNVRAIFGFGVSHARIHVDETRKLVDLHT